MKRNKFHFCIFLTFALSVFIHQSVFASNSQEDNNPRSVVEYLSKKKMPKAVNIDMHLRAGLNANFASTDDEKDETNFRFEQVMINIQGHVTPKLSYRFLQRMNKGTKVFETENLSSTIDYAYINYAVNDRFSVMAGRQFLFVGGFEFYEYPVYVHSYSTQLNNMTGYFTGLSLSYKPRPTQEIAFQLVNNRQGSMEEAFGKIPAHIEKPSAPLTYALAWNSSYDNDHIQLRYAASASELAKGKWQYMISGGQQFQIGKVTAYLDLLYQHSALDYLGLIRRMHVSPEGTAWNGVAENVDYFTTIVDVNYRFHPQWCLHLKGFYDRGSVYKANGAFTKGTYFNAWGAHGALEFFPMKDNNLRVFLYVTNREFDRTHQAQMMSHKDELRASLGFAYRLPVL